MYSTIVKEKQYPDFGKQMDCPLLDEYLKSWLSCHLCQAVWWILIKNKKMNAAVSSFLDKIEDDWIYWES